jgi:hypothetical protein
MATLDARTLASCFAISVERLPEKCRAMLGQHDFSYKVLEGRDRDGVILDVLRRIDSDSQVVGATERKAVWEHGWREALNEYVGSEFDQAKLVPKFIRAGQIVRLNRQFIVPADSNFELRFVEMLREWMFREFFSDIDTVHEFGCGTGFNLVSLGRIFPDKQLHGSDFVPASVELVNEIGQKLGLRLTARLFDMTAPPPNYALGKEDGVFTFGSLEQLAGRFERFLDFLLDRGPRICLHVEPTVELYDENELIDHLAIRFHRKRGYTQGFFPRLQALAAEGRIELLHARRLNFGSLMMEGYNLIVWRPLG